MEPSTRKPGLLIADALVLDPTRPFEVKQLSTFSDPDNPLHNLGHCTVYFLPDDTDTNGPNCVEFVNALNAHGKGHTHLLAQLTPGVSVSPKTVMIPTVTMNHGAQAMDMWTIGQEATARAICELVKDGIIPAAEADNWFCFVQVYIDPSNFPEEKGKPNRALWMALFTSTYHAAKDAWQGKQDVNWMLKQEATVVHPWGIGDPATIAATIAEAKKASVCVVGAVE